MTKQPPTLEARLAVALQPDTVVTSADVAALIEEAEAGIAKADKEAAVDQTRSLDPAAARQAIADATFAGNRLRTMSSKLQARYKHVCDEEKKQRGSLNSMHLNPGVTPWPKNCANSIRTQWPR